MTECDRFGTLLGRNIALLIFTLCVFVITFVALYRKCSCTLCLAPCHATQHT